MYEEEDDPEKTSKENQEKAEEGSLIRVLKESTNIGDASSFLSGENVLVCNLFRFGGDWWQTGALLDPTYEDNKAQIEAERNIQRHKKSIHDYNLLKQNGYGDKFVFIEDVKTMKEFLKNIGFELPSNISFPQKYEKGIIVYGSPYTGINISFGTAHCIASPENPYYNAERAAEDCFNIISGNGHFRQNIQRN